MLAFNPTPKLLHTKLIAIWAISESGLGGLLHAAKIPFSGILLGSFAVIIITFIAKSSEERFNSIIKATMLVVLIKAMVSPHSPPMAYVAVLFQGILGASLYGIFGVNKMTSASLGAIALLESAFQKILTLTIIFGMNLWVSIQQFFDGLQEKLNAEWITELPWLFLTIYGLLYFIVGILAGGFAFRLPEKVFQNAMELQHRSFEFTANKTPLKKRKRKRFWLIVALLLFSTIVFIFSGMPKQALSIILRTLAAIVFFMFLFNPIFKYFMQKWARKEKRKNQKTLNHIMNLMPDIKNNVGLAQQLSKQQTKVVNRLKWFVINWLSLSLYYSEDEQ
ncbi:hypothetical protein [Winogradskyella tangerina]|uniref:hypothetical protein n=1 Tax=Winogradskyella tangerina TaxID=2023240 RepID=UPI000DBE8742|nr:hypothetical protein [Winogradskyella tangerina]